MNRIPLTRALLTGGLLLAVVVGCGDAEQPPDDVVTALAEHGDEIASALESLCPIETDADGQIVAVDLTNRSPSHRGLDRIADLPQLRRLYLSSPTIRETGFRALLRCRKLDTLWIAGGNLDDPVWQALASLKQLKRLHLIVTPLSVSAPRQLAELENLEFLNIAGIGVTADTIDALTELEHLHTLILNQTRIGDDSVKALATIGSLRRISLNGLPIHDESLESLATGRQHGGRQRLNRNWPRISTAGQHRQADQRHPPIQISKFQNLDHGRHHLFRDSGQVHHAADMINLRMPGHVVHGITARPLGSPAEPFSGYDQADRHRT